MNIDDYPLVSAILLAGGTPLADILRCVACFEDQTYPNKELIIVTHNSLDIDNATIIQLDEKLTTGFARNRGIVAANGQIIAQFDANYWHAPNRISAQIATMANQNAHICMLASVLHYSYISGRARIFRNQQNIIPSTMVWVRNNEIQYQDIDYGEEYQLLRQLLHHDMKPIAMDKPELCCRLVLTNRERIITPTNVDLSEQQFSIIRTILDAESRIADYQA